MSHGKYHHPLYILQLKKTIFVKFSLIIFSHLIIWITLHCVEFINKLFILSETQDLKKKGSLSSSFL